MYSTSTDARRLFVARCSARRRSGLRRGRSCRWSMRRRGSCQLRIKSSGAECVGEGCVAGSASVGGWSCAGWCVLSCVLFRVCVRVVFAVSCLVRCVVLAGLYLENTPLSFSLKDRRLPCSVGVCVCLCVPGVELKDRLQNHLCNFFYRVHAPPLRRVCGSTRRRVRISDTRLECHNRRLRATSSTLPSCSCTTKRSPHTRASRGD
jgi:hypothetical protein